ncbi:MAG: FkbM family methyltransferase [Terriglobales bacterium]
MVRALNFKGKGSIVQRIRPESIAREVTVKCHGVRYQLDLRDDVQRELYFDVYERREIRDALRLIPPGGVCIDAGANNGAFALVFAKQVGETGLVHAFEPDSVVYSRLQANCQLNGFEGRLKCHQMAVSNVAGTLTFYKSDSQHSGWGSLAEFTDIAKQAESVQSTTLDDFLASENISHVDLLKVDVEAHEPELLEGARKSLGNHVFRFILIEFNGLRLKERGKSLQEFLNPLLTTGYEVVRPGPDTLNRMMTGSIPGETVLINFLFAAPS